MHNLPSIISLFTYFSSISPFPLDCESPKGKDSARLAHRRVLSNYNCLGQTTIA